MVAARRTATGKAAATPTPTVAARRTAMGEGAPTPTPTVAARPTACAASRGSSRHMARAASTTAWCPLPEAGSRRAAGTGTLGAAHHRIALHRPPPEHRGHRPSRPSRAADVTVGEHLKRKSLPGRITGEHLRPTTQCQKLGYTGEKTCSKSTATKQPRASCLSAPRWVSPPNDCLDLGIDLGAP